MVEEDLQFFLGIVDPSQLMGRCSKIKLKIEKSHFGHFLSDYFKTKISIMKCPFLFFFFSPWGKEGLIQTQLSTMVWLPWVQT